MNLESRRYTYSARDTIIRDIFVPDIERTFPNSKYAKKRDILSEKRESGMAKKTVSLRPKAHMGIGQIRRHIGDANLAGNN